MSNPYDCGHVRDVDHDDYCGVGACVVCMMRAQRDGLPPHGVVMTAERTLTIALAEKVFDGAKVLSPRPDYLILFRARVCGDCGMTEAMLGMDLSLCEERFTA